MLKKILKCWIPWLLLVLLLLYVTIIPVRGVIGPVTLPADDAFLPDEDVQWWYWTGHLKTEEGREFGYEIVFFTFDNFIFFKDQLIQGAITDVQDNSFHFDEHLRTFSLPKRLPNAFDLSSGSEGKITAFGGGGRDTLHSQIGDYVLDLKLESTKEPVIHYSRGPHPYRFGGFTYYYSRAAMATSGTLSINGETHKVTGSSWFDRQYGELYQAILQGWQWFAIELDDNTQIMLYDFNGQKNSIEKYASVTDAEGKTHDLGPDEFSVTNLGEWKSPHTGCTYPSGWAVEVEGEKWTIEPMVKDQELRAKHDLWVGPEYWEGSSYVKDRKGNLVGKAYVELNGYCRELVGD